jgi:hypothetical protein
MERRILSARARRPERARYCARLEHLSGFHPTPRSEFSTWRGSSYLTRHSPWNVRGMSVELLAPSVVVPRRAAGCNAEPWTLTTPSRPSTSAKAALFTVLGPRTSRWPCGPPPPPPRLYPYPSRSLPVVLAVTARTAVPPPEGEPTAHLTYMRSARIACERCLLAQGARTPATASALRDAASSARRAAAPKRHAAPGTPGKAAGLMGRWAARSVAGP